MNAATAMPQPDGPRAKGRVPPHNLEMEESLLGAMMLSAGARNLAEGFVRAEDFYKPAHQTIYTALARLHSDGAPCDPVALSTELDAHGHLEHVGGRAKLLDIHAQTPASASALHYARIVVSLASYRRLISAAGGIAEIGYDAELSPIDAVARAQEMIASAEVPLGGEPSEDVSQFLQRHTDHEWLWPGVLEVQERLLIVAPEKYGKSTMIRQMAVCLSQGWDPFRFFAIPPVLVHLVDLENPEPMVRRKIGQLYDACNTLEHIAVPETLRIDCQPQGLDLANSRADELWLQEKIAANRTEWQRQGFEADYPMVVCIGPVYKMLEDETKLDEVRRLQSALDRIRKRFKCALIMETHAPHESFHKQAGPRSLRPAGPRVWIRWPEFCRGFEPSTSIAAAGDHTLTDFYDVQGARDERDWPIRLRRGGKFPFVIDERL